MIGCSFFVVLLCLYDYRDASCRDYCRFAAMKFSSQRRIPAPSRQVRKLKMNPPLSTSNPKSVKIQPPIKPPATPVSMFASIPMDASRLLSLDATHPASPPMIIHPKNPNAGVIVFLSLYISIIRRYMVL